MNKRLAASVVFSIACTAFLVPSGEAQAQGRVFRPPMQFSGRLGPTVRSPMRSAPIYSQRPPLNFRDNNVANGLSNAARISNRFQRSQYLQSPVTNRRNQTSLYNGPQFVQAPAGRLPPPPQNLGPYRLNPEYNLLKQGSNHYLEERFR